MPSIAVVILNYNGKALLKKFLPVTIQCSGQARLIIADNNSSDGSHEFVASCFPAVELIRIPQNLGFCGGYNYALSRVVADYYVLLNSDVEVTPNWIDPIVEVFERDKNVGAGQPKIRSYNERAKFEYAGGAGGFIDGFGYPFCRGRLFDTLERDEHQYEGVAPVFWASGACLFIRSSLFNQLGGFDEDFFAHMEEIDLCWRLNRANYSVICCSDSVVYHIGGATLSDSNSMKTYYNFRNGIAMMVKNMRARALLVQLPIRILLDGIAVLRLLLIGQRSNAMAILKAYAHLVRTRKKLYRKRRTQRARLPFRKTDLIYNGSIVVDYFLLGKRSYQKLGFPRAKGTKTT